MSTFVGTQDSLEYIHKMSTQYLLEYFSSYQYSVLTRVLILSRSMPGHHTFTLKPRQQYNLMLN